MKIQYRWLSIPILAAAVYTAALRWMPRERLLMELAHVVANSEDAARYCWLSDHEMLLVRGGNYSPSRIQHLDLSTGIRERLPRLEKVVNKFSFEEEIFPSPEGKWLLFPPFDAESNAILVTKRGDRIAPQQTNGITALAWLPGSSRWFHLTYSSGSPPGAPDIITGIIIHDARHPGSIQSLPATQPVPFNNMDDPVITSDNHLLITSSMLDVAQNQTVARTVTDCALSASNVVPVRKVTIPLPQGASLGNPELVLSPQGDHIAYSCAIEQHSAWQTWLHRWFSRFTVHTQYLLAIYVARWDNGQTREIGHIYMPGNNSVLGGLHWSPNGSSLSFTYRDRLYVIPAD